MASKYYIGTEPIIVEGELSNFANTTIGEEVSFEFYIRESEVDTRPSTAATYGGSQGATYGGSNGFTYDRSLKYKTAQERYNRLKDYLNYAGYATTSRTLGSAYYTEPFDFANTSVDSLLVPIRPHGDINQARGVWGVITGGDDSTEIFGAIARIDLTVFVLAEYEDYTSENEVRAEFEATL